MSLCDGLAALTCCCLTLASSFSWVLSLSLTMFNIWANSSSTDSNVLSDLLGVFNSCAVWCDGGYWEVSSAFEVSEFFFHYKYYYYCIDLL